MFPQKDYIHGQVNVENVLKRTTPFAIFTFYVGKFTPGKAFKSPFRKDNKPSFSISKQNGVWFFKDFSTGENGDCFTFVQKKYSCDFIACLNRINSDLGLGLINGMNVQPGVFVHPHSDRPDFIKKKVVIRVKSRQWLLKDKDYWEPYGITKDILELYNVRPLSHYWINEHCFTVKDLCYGYRFGSNLYKIYSPLKTQNKWYSNVTSNVIQGFDQLENRSDQLIITKSLKDVMVLRSVGIEAIAPQAESVLLSQSQINYFKERYSQIYCLFDWDRAGRHLSWLCRSKYGITPIKFSDSDNPWKMKQGLNGCKDISDFVKLHGKEEFLSRIN